MSRSIKETRINRINKLDLRVLGCYILLWLALGSAYLFKLTDQSTINKGMIAIGLGGSFLLYMVYYKRLRIASVSLLWTVIGVLQVTIMLLLRRNPDFDAVNGHYSTNLVYLPIMIIIFNLMRGIYYLIYKQELVITAARYEWVAYEDGRKLIFMDYFLSVIGAVLFILIPTLIIK